MSLGVWELMLILAIVFVLFGAGKLPQVMSDLGKGVKSLKEGLKGEQNQEKDQAQKKASDQSSQASEAEKQSDKNS
jgi:sec-independent protein translocase protein TatA